MKQTPNTPRAMKHVVQSNEALSTTLDPSALRPFATRKQKPYARVTQANEDVLIQH